MGNNDATKPYSLADGIKNEMEEKYLTFWTANQLFAIPISEVEQIVGLQEITEIPEYPFYAKGIINLRGSVIPVIDIRLRLGKPEIEYGDRTCIIIIEICSRNFGFIVDQVSEVTTIPDDKISQPPDMNQDTLNQFVKGIAQTGIAEDSRKMALVLSTAKLLGTEEIELLANV